MGSVNKCIFVGHLGRDAEVKYTTSGAAVASLSMACSEQWTDKGGQKQERTEWVRVQVWGKTAETIGQYLTKGKLVYVEGKMQTRKWSDKDGNDRYTTEIRADRVVLLSKGESAPAAYQPAVRPAERGESDPLDQPDEDDDLPFMWLLPLMLPILSMVLS